MSNDKTKNPIEMRVNAASKHADIFIYGYVGYNVTAKDVVRQLQQEKSLKTIDVYINTNGGYFSEGLAIANNLKRHSAHVTTHNDGYALSMGSVILLAGDTIKMAQNSLTMIHRAQGGAYGDASDLRKGAKILDSHEKAVLSLYANRLNISEDEVQKLLNEETWYSASEALTAGLIDEITDEIDLEEKEKELSSNSWKEARNFKNAPEEFTQRLSANLEKDEEAPNWAKRLLSSFAKKTPSQSQNNLNEDDEMSPEQFEQFTAQMKENHDAMMSAITVTAKEKNKKAGKKSSKLAKTENKKLKKENKKLAQANKKLNEKLAKAKAMPVASTSINEDDDVETNDLP